MDKKELRVMLIEDDMMSTYDFLKAQYDAIVAKKEVEEGAWVKAALK